MAVNAGPAAEQALTLGGDDGGALPAGVPHREGRDAGAAGR
jgi:hypothetical protein